jgi:prepilin-type N-terminal cleavage/methylation domain-containing protein
MILAREKSVLRSRNGFTVIELVIVLVIIGILVAIAIPKLTNNKTKEYRSAMRSDLRSLMTAQEAFFMDSAYYTANLAKLKFHSSPGVSTPKVTAQQGAWSATVTHKGVPGEVCGIGINTANPIGGTSAVEGEPTCK